MIPSADNRQIGQKAEKLVARISVRNTAYAALFTPVYAVFPILLAVMPQELKKSALIAGACIVLLLTVLMIILVSRPVFLELYTDRIQFAKRVFPVEVIKSVRYTRRGRYVTIRTTTNWRGITLQVNKLDEADSTAVTLDNWSRITGVSFVDM